MLSRSLRHRAPLLWVLLPTMMGIVAGHFSKSWSKPSWWVALGAVALVAAWFSRTQRLAWSLAFPSAICLLSTAYFQLREPVSNAFAESPPSERLLHLEIERVFLGNHSSSEKMPRVSGIGKIVRAPQPARAEPRRGSDSANAPSKQHQRNAPTLGEGDWIYFSARGSVEDARHALRTAVIEVRGGVEAVPREPAPHSFEEYLQSAGVSAKLSRGRLLAVDREPSLYAAACESLRLRLDHILGLGLETRPALAAENRALFLGEVGGLGETRKHLFVETGTLHFFAIDGLHIAAIAVALNLLFGLTRCPKTIAFVTAAGVLWIYADLTGRSPSAVRAVLTVLFFEGAYLLRRPINPLAGLSASATIALLLSPRELFGASFQMSYGIVAGLLLLGLPLAERWQAGWTLFRLLPRVSWSWWHHALHAIHRHLISGVAIGLATALVADICGVLFFQLYSPSSLLANLVLIPAASVALWANFCAAIAGLAHVFWLANVFNHAAALILIAMEFCIRFLVTLPWAVLPRQFVSMQHGFIALAALLVAMLFGYATRWSWRFGGWLSPVAITLFALIVLTR